MKEIYLDIMEKALSAYTSEQIEAFMDDVGRNGITEHGFPRLAANIGILVAHGRRAELKDILAQMMELCTDGFPKTVRDDRSGNNFSIREVCCAVAELEKAEVYERGTTDRWKKRLAALDCRSVYSHIVSDENRTPGNWACFGALSEQARGILCGFDATAFLENQIPSQLLRLDDNGMYRDAGLKGPHQPVLYDLMTRTLLLLSLYWGYKGRYATDIEQMAEASDELTLKMQSVTGELAFGGRSNQCTFNETVLAGYCELRATLLKQKGDERAGAFKAAAERASAAALYWLGQEPMSHVKNRFEPASKLGCEPYAYFNKYMITVASNAYLAYLAADDSIAPTVTPADVGGYVAETGEDFHKVFISAGGYCLLIDCNADTHYDAGGLGRVHKKGCDPRVCLSVPFPAEKANYKVETPNRHPLAICGYKNTADGMICSADGGIKHVLVSKNEGDGQCSAIFDCVLDKERLFTEKYTVSSGGVEIEFCGADGILVPAFLFDGLCETEIATSVEQILIKYNGSFCKYTFEGEPQDYGVFFNRNGRYRAYKIATDRLHIEIGDINEL